MALNVLEVLNNELVRKGIVLVVVVVVAIVVQTILDKAIKRIFERGNVPQGSIVVNLVRTFIWSVALLLVLEPVFGMQPTAFVAALGIGSVALSFGLQTTVSNVISGIGLMVAHVIEVGDWIEVGGYQGIVTDITWRSTTVHSLVGDVIVIPNSVLNSTTLRKLSPFTSTSVTIPLNIHPLANMAEVEQQVRELVETAVEEWRDPRLPVDLIHQGYGSLGFELDVRVPLLSMDNALRARSAIVAACSGNDWLARW